MITSTRNTNTSATSSTRTRRGGSCLKDIYETFLIYRTCMRRAPAKPVRACTLRKLCPASHVTLEAPRHTSHLTVFTLHTAHFAVNTSHFSVHTALSPIHTSHSTLHTSQSTLHTSHFTLHTPHFTLHTPHFTLHSSSHLSSSHLIPAHLFQNWISTPKRQKDDFEALFKRNFKRKIISAKIEKICWQITFAALMQPFQYDLRSSAAKDNSITHAAAAPSNLDAATTMRSAETELQNTIELRAMASEIAAPKPSESRRQSDKKTILKHFLKGILKGKLLAPKLRKSADKSLSQPWCSHSNTIYDLQL